MLLVLLWRRTMNMHFEVRYCLLASTIAGTQATCRIMSLPFFFTRLRAYASSILGLGLQAPKRFSPV